MACIRCVWARQGQQDAPFREGWRVAGTGVEHCPNAERAQCFACLIYRHFHAIVITFNSSHRNDVIGMAQTSCRCALVAKRRQNQQRACCLAGMGVRVFDHCDKISPSVLVVGFCQAAQVTKRCPTQFRRLLWRRVIDIVHFDFSG